MDLIIFFIIDMIFIFLLYYFLFIRKSRRNYKMPAEAQYLINLYKLDINKFSYRKFVIITGLVTSFDISLIALIVAKVDDITWQLLFGLVAVVPVAIISFMVLGKYYQHKQTQDNKEELAKEAKYLEKQDKKEEKKVQKRKAKNIKEGNKKGKKKNVK